MSDFFDGFQELNIPLHGVRLPKFTIEDSHKKQFGITEDITTYEFLRKICLEGFAKLNLEKGSEDYKKYSDRTKYELGVINELGFVDYILMVWDVTNFCRINNVPIGRGRGSAPGSIVLYLSGVTKVDPIRYGLFFERFISKVRARQKVVDGISYIDGALAPDVDLDLDYYKREDVIKYLEEKYKGRVCKIATFNTLSGKSIIKECGKIVGGKSDEQMTQITEMIPKVHGIVKDLEESYDEVLEFKKWCDENPQVYSISLKLKDLNKNKSVHASAISISYENINDFTPTELDSNKNEVSSYDMSQVSLFNIKLDILGLRGVSVVDDACQALGIKEENIDVEDPFIYQNLQDFEYPHGIFQLEADTNYKVAHKAKPRNLEELSAVIALARPGALQFVDKFCSYVAHGTYESIHPFFDDVLKNTGGICAYQEQLMKMVNKVGFTLDEAETVRRLVSKKKVEEMKEWEVKINNKIKEQNLDPAISPLLWKIMSDSSSYSFNRSHSVAYASLAASTIYLKFKYPLQFFLSLLKMTRFEQDPVSEISKIHKEMRHFGIELLRPHITKSQLNFAIEDGNIRFGLLSIKGISDKSIEKLNNFKNEYSTKFEVFEGANAAELNNNILCGLIQSGCFEGFKQSRCKVVYEAQLWNILTDKEKKLALTLEKDFDYDLVNIVLELAKRKNEKGKPHIKESRLETIKKRAEPYKQILLLNSKSEAFCDWGTEKRLLGYTYGKTLIDIFINKNPNLISLHEIRSLPNNSEVYFIAEVEANAQSRTSKNGNKYISFDCGDETAGVNVKIFTKSLESAMLINDGKTPKKGQIVMIKGSKKEGNCIFASEYGIQNNKIYEKFADIREEKLEKEAEALDKLAKNT